MDKNLTRPPIVVVLGHVDHGKTTLLDTIRKTSVVRREAGGITQSIGATVALTKAGKEITFIDTPGHALFSGMRSRGVILADIAILVVAVDDGVQPQTKEAIKLLQESSLPFVVALTKIDVATAAIETTLAQLEKEGVYFEKRGGNVSYIGVSAKNGEGIDELLDVISLTSEVNGLKGDDDGKLSGFVIETKKDKKGLVVSAIIKSGKVKVGQTIFANEIEAKIKGLFDDNLKPVKEGKAGYPIQILGFSDLPKVGSLIASEATKQEEKPEDTKTRDEGGVSEAGGTLVKIFVKAKTTGSLEALLGSMPEGVAVIGSGVGDVTESDLFLAKAAGANMYLFEAKYATTVKRLAETENVKLVRFEIIYDLIEKLKEIVKSGEEEILGKAQIVASFPYNNKRVAGCKVMSGKIGKNDKIKLMRGEKEIGKVKIVSIKKQKQEVNEVKQGEECGIYFTPNLDFGLNDVLLSVGSK